MTGGERMAVSTGRETGWPMCCGLSGRVMLG